MDEPIANVHELLGLDLETLRAVAQASEAYGLALRAAEDPATRLESASLLTLAASCWMFLDIDRAGTAFSSATLLYEQLGRSYALITAACAGSREILRSANGWEVGGADGIPTTEYAYRLTYIGWLAALDLHAARKPEELYEDVVASVPGYLPSGRLEIPLSSYERVVQSIFRLKRHQSRARFLAESVREFLARAMERIGPAMSDTYHWRRLQAAVFPVEPEILATMTAVVLAGGPSASSWLESPRLGRVETAFLELAVRLARKVQSRDEP
jgi:hypothetical protein